jgi:hypothetical protein
LGRAARLELFLVRVLFPAVVVQVLVEVV